MGIFGRNIGLAYGPKNAPLAIASPWSPQDALVTFALADALPALEGAKAAGVTITRDIALRIPAVQRAHAYVCKTFAGIRFYVMQDEQRVALQPEWTYTSSSGVSPYHAAYGMASDWFFYGWALLGFTADLTDKMHVPYGLWYINDEGYVEIDDRIPERFRARPVAIPLGYGNNGLLTDGADTLAQARKIEFAYNDRLDNPVPLTLLGIPRDVYESWTDDELQKYLDDYVARRKSAGGSVALKVAEFPIDMPGLNGEVNLFETGRNAVRLDIANHTGMPASFLEGLRQGGGGGGTEIKYSGVANGVGRNELWDFGPVSGYVAAFEARMSLDDVLPGGQSLRADLASIAASSTPIINTPSED